jgi:SNF2 family DNA or RNA helicase
MMTIEQVDYKYKREPYDHQRFIFEHSRDYPAFALLMEMGTGKTKVVIDTMAWLYAAGEIEAVLIVAPNGVHANWIDREIPRDLPDHVEVTARVYNSRGNTKKYIQGMADLGRGHSLKVLAMNVEALATKKGQAYARKLCTLYRTLAIVDESTRIKNYKAKRSAFAHKLGQWAAYTRILTGTPVTQNPLDVWSQFEFLDPEILRHGSYFTFKNRHAKVIKREARKTYVKKGIKVTKRWKFEDIVGFKNIPELVERIDPYSFRVTKEECLDLPPKIFEEISVPLSPQQKAAYKEMKEQLLLELESGEVITAPMALIKLIKLQQICGGFIKDEAGNTHTIPGPNSKLDALLYSLEDVPEDISVIIWSRFIAEIDAIHDNLSDAFGRGCCGRYYGSTTANERSRLIDSFQCGDTRFFIGNTASAGLGLTLTKASLVYYFSNDFSLENRLQSEDRAHRIGQHNPVVYKDLVCPNTIDRHVLRTLKDKTDLAELVTGGLQTYRSILE